MTITARTLALELRIHERGTETPDDNSVEFTFGQDRLLMPASFGGQRVQYVDARTETEPFWLELLDVSGEVSGIIADAGGRMQMLGRIAELRLAADGGAFATLGYRRLSQMQSGSEGVYRLELSDERWLERRTFLFEKTTSWQFFPYGLTAPFMNTPAAGTLQFVVQVVTPDYVVLFGHQHKLIDGLLDLVRNDVSKDLSVTAGSFVELRFEDATQTNRPILRFDPDYFTLFEAGGVAAQLNDPLGPHLVTGRFDLDGITELPPHWETALLYWPSHGFQQGDTTVGRFHWPNGIDTTEAAPVLIGGAAGIRARELLRAFA